MRLMQLLGILLSLLVLSTLAAAAGSQLTSVSVAPQGAATTVTIKVSGAFTHTEYRPTDNLLMVDMTGVSASKLDGKSETLHGAPVTSYRVLGYQGPSGTAVTRVELALAANTHVNVSESSGVLQVKLSGMTPAAATKPAAITPTVKTAKAETNPGVATIQKISVARAKQGMDVEIHTSTPVVAHVMKLTNPDRLVLDVPAAPGSARSMSVNQGAVKGVRVARRQAEPPVTRIVVDLAKAQPYDVKPAGNTLVLQVGGAETVATPSAPSKPAEAPVVLAKAEAAPAANEKSATQPAATTAVAAPPATPAATPAAAPQSASTKADNFVFVEPQFQAKSDAQAPQQAAPTTPLVRAEEAASKFNAPAPQVPLTNASLKGEPSKLALQQQAAMPAQTGTRPKYTGEPISVNLKDVDLKDFFRLIHEISGLNVVLDPNVHGTLTIVLDDVPWDQALDIVLKNNGLDRQLEGNVLRIATVDTLRKEADAQRARIEAQALAADKITVTRVLSYAHAKDVVPTIKKFLTSRGDVIADDRTNSLIIQDIPSVFKPIDDLIAQLDRKSEEVEIEARVVAATRSFARDIGTQLGFGWGNTPTAVGGTTESGTSPLQNTLPGGVVPKYFTVPGAAGAIPLFSNMPAIGTVTGGGVNGISFLNATADYRLDFILTMAESRGLLKILSRPRIVTQNNIAGLVRQGVRVPVVTQAQLGGPPTVTYVDAFLRLSVTPQITAEGTIFLNLDVENTTPDFTRQVQGNPTLLTQQATTSVLITDGGTVTIGGVIQTQNQVQINQVPLLGNIPLLGELFKHRVVSTSTQELIFFITPKIIQT